MNYLFGDWLKNYNDSLFMNVNSVSEGKAQPISLAILRLFLVIFGQLHEHLSQIFLGFHDTNNQVKYR